MDGALRLTIEMVYDELVDGGDWPKTKKLNIALYRKQIDLQKVLYRNSDFVRGSDTYRDDARTDLRLRALLYVPRAEDDSRWLVKLLRHLGDLYCDDPNLSEVPALQAAGAIGLTDERTLARLLKIISANGSPLLAHERIVGQLDAASIGVNASFVRFSTANSLEEILDAIDEHVRPLGFDDPNELTHEPEKSSESSAQNITIQHAHIGGDVVAGDKTLFEERTAHGARGILHLDCEGLSCNYEDPLVSLRRLRIKNRGNKTITNVRVELGEFTPQNSPDLPLLLRRMNSEGQPFELHPGGSTYIDVVEWPKDAPEFLLCYVLPRPNTLAPRRYALSVIATGTDVPAATANVVIDLDSEKRITIAIEPQQSG